ncbi:hypothetical protein [Pontibacter arcticus]|uniref:DUF3311 domain-containing protein n=1 Tax=Pontibacter arcticus TaxID=2080288 RepID=A0A364RH55_9BACT|nr:hypothetical protein [Pontibacter arcticus]RAU83648.1 hypothetical protein DP923_00810 [Pontibacter arcticus]
MRDRVKGRRLFFISALFLVLLNYPVLSIFNKSKVIMGVPLLYFYLMLAWLACIGSIAWFVERERIKKTKQK